MSRTLFALMIGASFLFSVLPTETAQAYPLIKPGQSISALNLPPQFTANYDFEGIVSLSGCSGSLVKLETSKDTDKAMVLTNGHCVEFGFPPPGSFYYGRNSRARFGLLNTQGQTVSSANASQLIYATMTKTDMALYKLTESYEEITRRTGIRPVTMSSQRPNKGDKIEVISGYWKRGYSCAIDGFAFQLKEGNWVNEDSIRYTNPGCEVIGGTSGSPILLAGSRTVLGVNNTGNENGLRCTNNNPCEIDEKGNVTYQQGLSYAQQTYWVYSCLNSNNEFDLSVSGCLLPH